MAFNLQKFTESYGSVVEKAWTDPTYLEKLRKDPKATLKSEGLETPDGATINVVMRKRDPNSKLSTQVDAWKTGERTNVYDVFVPIKPAPNAELTQGTNSADPCCCCPCSCC